MLLYVNTYMGFYCGDPQGSVLLISWFHVVCQIGRQKRVAAATPFVLLLFCWVLFLRSGFRNEVVNVAAFIALLLQKFNVLQVNPKRHHLLTSTALGCILTSYSLLGLLLLFFLHNVMH